MSTALQRSDYSAVGHVPDFHSAVIAAHRQVDAIGRKGWRTAERPYALARVPVRRVANEKQHTVMDQSDSFPVAVMLQNLRQCLGDCKGRQIDELASIVF